MGFSRILLLASVSIFALVNSASIDNNIQLKNVKRSIDISSQIVKTSDVVTVENTGSGKVSAFLVAIEPKLQDNVAFLEAKVDRVSSQEEEDEEDNGKLEVTPVQVKERSDVKFYEIKLPIPLGAGQTQVVTVDSSYMHALTPYPSQISQSEKQLILFKGNHYIFTPYKSVKQQTVVTLSSDKVESFTKLKPTSHSDTTITYGPYNDVAPFSQDALSVHYENNQPFLTVVNIHRVVEVSHWGNIAVEEEIDIVHTGAQLRGPFSRYDYQRDPSSGLSSVKSFKTVLPAAATDVYYRDEIGNISTSSLREHDEYLEVELRPRFPLFGGWKTHYTLGYNVPSYEYLFNQGDQFVLKMRFIDHIFDDMVVDQAFVKVILPEGCKSILTKMPYAVKRGADREHFTYLDTTGRPVITFSKEGLVEHHIQDFEIQYEFRKLMMLREPLLIVGAFYLLFMAVIVYVRLDFSISKDEQSESRARVSGIAEHVVELHGRRSALYTQYEAMIAAFKQSKDANKMSVERKRLDGETRTINHTIQELVAKLKMEAGQDVATKLMDVQRLDKSLKELLNQMIGYTEKVVGGKMNKSQFVETEKAFNEKKQDVAAKIDVILAQL